MRKLAFIVIAAGLLNGCGGGQTQSAYPDSPKGQTRCRPDMRCGPVEDADPPPKTSESVVIPN